MSWRSRTIRDPDVRCSEQELDREKQRATFAMIAARSDVIWAADMLASVAYNKAHVALLKCRTEEEIARVELGYVDGMKMVKGMIDVAK